MCLLEDRQLVCTRGGNDTCDEAAENLSLECGNSECSKKSSKRHSPLSDKLDELDRTE